MGRVTNEQAENTVQYRLNDSRRALSDRGGATAYEVRLAADLLDARTALEAADRMREFIYVCHRDNCTHPNCLAGRAYDLARQATKEPAHD